MAAKSPTAPKNTKPRARVKKIWNGAPHNAFTDLLRYQDRWWCIFREGENHISPDGVLRLLTSADGERWESAALLQTPRLDLRDPKLSVTPDGKLMIVAAGVRYFKHKRRLRSYAWFSSDGRRWSRPKLVAEPDYWLWRIAWQGGLCLGVAYLCGQPSRHTRLYGSPNGRDYQTVVEVLHDEGFSNESALLFQPDGTALCLLRRDPENGLLGRAAPPYRQWRWQDLGRRIGGPQMIRLPDGRLVAAVRLYDETVRTSLCWVDANTGRLEEFLALPSGGDNSYPGLAWHDGRLWVSYYSSHEDETAVYLARLRLPP